MPNLKPCPFCGSINIRLNTSYTESFIICDNCGGRGPVVEGSDYIDQDFAGSLWSTRKRGKK